MIVHSETPYVSWELDNAAKSESALWVTAGVK